MLAAVKRLKKLGFDFLSVEHSMLVTLPRTGELSEIKVFGNLEAKHPRALKDFPAGTFVRDSLFFIEPKDVPYPDLFIGLTEKSKPQGMDMMEWEELSARSMNNVAYAVESLDTLVKKLGPYKNSVDIVWDRSGWILRTPQGQTYRSVESYVRSIEEPVAQRTARKAPKPRQYSPIAMDDKTSALNEGFYVTDDGLFAVKKNSPLFDYYDDLVLSETAQLDELGFSLKSRDAYMEVRFPETAQTPIFESLEADSPTPLHQVNTAAFIRPTIQTPNLRIGLTEKVKPEEVSFLDWTNTSMGELREVREAYEELDTLIKHLGPYQNTVDIVWDRNRFRWVLRAKTDGKIYDSADHYWFERIRNK